MDKNMKEMKYTMETMSTGFKEMLDVFKSSAMNRQASTKDDVNPQAEARGGGV